MAATATSTDRVIDTRIGGSPRSRGGNGFRKNGGEHDDGGEPLRFSPARYRIGVWAAIAGIVMLFTALASAYIVRSASGNDWQPLVLPKVLWLSSALIVISSVTIEISRRNTGGARLLAHTVHELSHFLTPLVVLTGAGGAWPPRRPSSRRRSPVSGEPRCQTSDGAVHREAACFGRMSESGRRPC